MTLTIVLADELEQQLQHEARRHGLSVTEYSAQILVEHIAQTQRSQAAIELLESWLQGDADEQRATGQELIRLLDEDRLSARQLYPPEHEGVTW